MSDSRRKKLGMLTQSIAKGDFAAAGRLLRASANSSRAQAPAGETVPLEQACPGTEAAAVAPAGPLPYWLVRRSLAEISPDSGFLSEQYGAVLRGARQQFDELEASAAVRHVANAGPEDLLFLDTETCGLFGTGIFLVGLMSYADGRFVFEQHFARNYAEEPAILHAFAGRLAEAKILVTFNGKSFDMNMIRERSAFHGVALPADEPVHLDLLHESRRR